MADHAQCDVFLALYRDVGVHRQRDCELDSQPFA